MKRRLVAVTLSLIMTMATVSEAGAAAFTSPDTAPAVATQTDAEEVNVTEETSETEADAFSDGDDGTAVPSQEQTDDAFTAGTDTAAALPDETPSTADATDAVGAAVVKAEDWVSTENGFKLRKPAKNQPGEVICKYRIIPTGIRLMIICSDFFAASVASISFLTSILSPSIRDTF